jgi:hypothetical protein
LMIYRGARHGGTKGPPGGNEFESFFFFSRTKWIIDLESIV